MYYVSWYQQGCMRPERARVFLPRRTGPSYAVQASVQVRASVSSSQRRANVEPTSSQRRRATSCQFTPIRSAAAESTFRSSIQCVFVHANQPSFRRRSKVSPVKPTMPNGYLSEAQRRPFARGYPYSPTRTPVALPQPQPCTRLHPTAPSPSHSVNHRASPLFPSQLGPPPFFSLRLPVPAPNAPPSRPRTISRPLPLLEPRAAKPSRSRSSPSVSGP